MFDISKYPCYVRSPLLRCSWILMLCTGILAAQTAITDSAPFTERERALLERIEKLEQKVAVLEHNAEPGRKILISGGGRCNFTNLYCAPDRFISENRHFGKSALALYEPRHFIELVDRYGIRWHEKTLGQLFCDQSSRQIVDMLLAECAASRVEVTLNARQATV